MIFNLLCELYFKMDVDEVIHSRVVYKLMDWLGDLGGVGDVIMLFASILFSGYFEFHSGIETLTHFYSN